LIGGCIRFLRKNGVDSTDVLKGQR
jgi:hypothetical protein